MGQFQTVEDPDADEPNTIALEMVRKFITPFSEPLYETNGFLIGKLSRAPIPHHLEFNCNGKNGIYIRFQFELILDHLFLPQLMEFVIRSNSNNPFKLWDFDFESQVLSLSHWEDINPSKQENFRDMCQIIFLTAETAFPYLVGVISGLMSPKVATEISNSTYIEDLKELNNNISNDRKPTNKAEAQ